MALEFYALPHGRMPVATPHYTRHHGQHVVVCTHASAHSWGNAGLVFGRPYLRDTDIPLRWEQKSAHLGLAPLNDIDGSFVAVAYEEAACWVATDRYASQPLYMCINARGQHCVGTDPRRLAEATQHSVTVDYHGLLQWLLFGYIPSRRTLFSGVSRVPYGTWLCLNTGEMRPYWRFGCTQTEPSELSEAANIEKLSRLETEAVRRVHRNGDTPLLLLSGGWDSRAMAWRLKEVAPHQPLHALTFGPDGSQDVLLAQRIASSIGAVHTVRDYTHASAPMGMPQWAGLFGDLCDNVFASLPDGPGQITNLPGSVLWLGTDSFSTVLPPQPPPQNADIATELLCGAVASKALPPAFLQYLGALPSSHQGLADEAFGEVAELTACSHNTFAQAFDRLAHETRFRVWNINRRLFEADKEVVTPFHDAELVEFYSSLPVPLRAKRLAHQEANRVGHWMCRDLPFVSGHLPRNHLDALRASKELRQEMWRTIQQCGELGGAIDVAFVADMVVDEPSIHDAVLLVFLRLYMVATTFAPQPVPARRECVA